MTNSITNNNLKYENKNENVNQLSVKEYERLIEKSNTCNSSEAKNLANEIKKFGNSDNLCTAIENSKKIFKYNKESVVFYKALKEATNWSIGTQLTIDELIDRKVRTPRPPELSNSGNTSVEGSKMTFNQQRTQTTDGFHKSFDKSLPQHDNSTKAEYLFKLERKPMDAIEERSVQLRTILEVYRDIKLNKNINIQDTLINIMNKFEEFVECSDIFNIEEDDEKEKEGFKNDPKLVLGLLRLFKKELVFLFMHVKEPRNEDKLINFCCNTLRLKQEGEKYFSENNEKHLQELVNSLNLQYLYFNNMSHVTDEQIKLYFDQIQNAIQFILNNPNNFEEIRNLIISIMEFPFQQHD